MPGKRIAYILIAFTLFLPTTVQAQPRPKRLNNLVTQLLARSSITVPATTQIKFNNPRQGWVYIQATHLRGDSASLNITLEDPHTPLITGLSPNQKTIETMRILPRGTHTLTLKSKNGKSRIALTVRTMPETHFIRYPQQPYYPQLGDFSWDWLDRHVLASVNTIAGRPGKEFNAIIDDWTSRGRKLIAYGGLPHTEGISPAETFAHWDTNPGFKDPRLAGLLADEFQGRQHPLYPSWTEGMRLLGEKYKGTGKAFYAYCGGPGMYTRPETRALVRTVFDAGFHMAWERYHHEMPTLPEAKKLMNSLLGNEMKRWRNAFPECQKQIVLVLGLFAMGPDLDVQPNVNYKVWMDMQMQYLATHPLYDGLFGVHWWYTGGANEELLRWQSALYRHYCIEGQTQLLSKKYGWTYEMNHIQNPDFYNNFKGWTTTPAAQDTMTTAYLERYARIQGRYWHRTTYPDDPAGNTYALLKRNANAPNTLTQTIHNLTPGQLYTVQLITADHQDILNGHSEKKTHTISINILNAQPIPQLTYTNIPKPSHTSHPQLPFNNGPAYFNHHRLAFRATSPTATLQITDWQSLQAPGAPTDQQLMLNYIQLQPYYEQQN